MNRLLLVKEVHCVKTVRRNFHDVGVVFTDGFAMRLLPVAHNKLQHLPLVCMARPPSFLLLSSS